MVCDYLTYFAESGIMSTGLDSAKWAIDQVHELKKLDVPSTDGSVRNHLKGLRRILIEDLPPQARLDQKQPLTIECPLRLYFPKNLLRRMKNNFEFNLGREVALLKSNTNLSNLGVIVQKCATSASFLRHL